MIISPRDLLVGVVRPVLSQYVTILRFHKNCRKPLVFYFENLRLFNFAG